MKSVLVNKLGRVEAVGNDSASDHVQKFIVAVNDCGAVANMLDRNIYTDFFKLLTKLLNFSNCLFIDVLSASSAHAK